MSTAINVNRKKLEPGAFCACVGDEVFANLNDDHSRIVSDRNRFSIGLGWLATDSWSVEARNSYQNTRDAATSDFHLTDCIIEMRM